MLSAVTSLLVTCFSLLFIRQTLQLMHTPEEIYPDAVRYIVTILAGLTTRERLVGYPLIVVPDCFTLTENEQAILLQCAEEGSRILVYGRLAEGSDLAKKLAQTGNAVFVDMEEEGEAQETPGRFMEAFRSMYGSIAPVECVEENIGVQRYDRDGRTWIHILNYSYDKEGDRITPLSALKLKVRDVPEKMPDILVPKGDPVPTCDLKREGASSHLTLKGAGLYTILAF